jgi:hypothetical protein
MAGKNAGGASPTTLDAGGGVVTALYSGVATGGTTAWGTSGGATMLANGLGGGTRRIFGSARSCSGDKRLCFRLASSPAERSPGDRPAIIAATVFTPSIA